MKLYLGTYTMPILFGTGEVLQGQGKGIYRLHLNQETGKCTLEGLVAETDNPSFLALSRDGKHVYAVNELKKYEGKPQGAVSAFAVQPGGALALLGSKPTGGQDPCHVLLPQGGNYALVSNFMTGSVCGYAIQADGALGHRSAFIQHEGSSVDEARQKGPHAHSFIQSPDGKYLFVPDLGLDQLVIYTMNDSDSLRPAGAFHCQKGNGPRFGEFHPQGRYFYLINELASSVTVLAYDGSPDLREVQTVSTVDAGAPPNTCADLHITPDGRYLYASNRGDDSLAAFAIHPETGQLTKLHSTPCGGRTPRQFMITPDGRYLCVGNQDSNNIAVFAIQPDGGLVQRDLVEAPTPVCLIAASPVA